jgi:cytochrome c-type biogenesis protein CcmH/NrfG
VVFLGSAYRKSDQFADTIDALQHATKLEPGHLNYWLGLAGAYQDRN